MSGHVNGLKLDIAPSGPTLRSKGFLDMEMFLELLQIHLEAKQPTST